MKPINALTYLKDFKTDGHSPVLVLADDGFKYVAKPYKSVGFDYCIFNELFAHSLLKHWNIPTPEIALIKIEKELLKHSINAKKYNRSYYENFFFGSRFIDNAIDLNGFLNFGKQADFKKIKDPVKLIRLGLFDIWIENDDRKPTNFNILLESSDKYLTPIAIDNAFIFSTLPYSDLKEEFVCNSFNDNVLFSQFAKQILKKVKPSGKWMQQQRDLFYLCVKNCEDHFDAIITDIAPHYRLSESDHSKLKSFLFSESRNKMVFEEFLSRL